MSTLVPRLYRQLLRSSSSYANQCDIRGLMIGHELQRVLAVHKRNTNAWTSVTTRPAETNPSAAAISTQLDQWMQHEPDLFELINDESTRMRQKEIDRAATMMERAKAAKILYRREEDDETINSTSGVQVDDESSSSASASTPYPSSSSSSNPLLYGPPSPALPSTPGRGAPSMSRNSTVSPTPQWVTATYRCGLESRVLSEEWLHALMSRAFRCALRTSDVNNTESKERSFRLSNAFALHKRLSSRGDELTSLPLRPLRSSSTTIVPGLVDLSLRSLGLFKQAGNSYFFRVQWSVKNLSDSTRIALLSHTVKLQMANSKSDKDMSSDTLGARTRGSHTSTSIGGPSSSSSSSTPSPSISSSIISNRPGLAGRAIDLPAGSSIPNSIASVQLDSSIGSLSASVTFRDYSSTPPRDFELHLDPIVLDAQAPVDAESLVPIMIDEAQEKRDKSRREHQTARDMLTASAKDEAAKVGNGEGRTPTPSA